MSIIRKLAVSTASLIIGITGIVLGVGTSNSVADCGWDSPIPCSPSMQDARY
ncbi:MAG: hypothetical protein ACRDSK_22825 [Actinophytocola sp.]|uniref:hypothetical protein n=1 Tax=Actinophytocola sp. TaxID=1872138 RepID=UPI003D6B6C7D